MRLHCCTFLSGGGFAVCLNFPSSSSPPSSAYISHTQAEIGRNNSVSSSCVFWYFFSWWEEEEGGGPPTEGDETKGMSLLLSQSGNLKKREGTGRERAVVTRWLLFLGEHLEEEGGEYYCTTRVVVRGGDPFHKFGVRGHLNKSYPLVV